MADRVVLIALALRPDGAGVSTYIRELSAALVEATDVPIAAVVQADAIGVLHPRIEPIVRSVRGGALRALENLRPVKGAALVHGLDVDLPLRATRSVSPTTLRSVSRIPPDLAGSSRQNGVPTVATIHDLSVFDTPWAHSRTKAVAERAIYRRTASRADALIAVSSFTAARVAAVFGRVASVVHEAPSSAATNPADEATIAELRQRLALPEQFVLHVGTVEPRKDVPTLGDACVRAGLPLVLAGRVSDPALVPPGALALGFVDAADLPALYGAATVVAYPSLYEGFGLPPLEAMAMGAAVVATDAGALAEVLGDGASIVPTGDAGALAAAISALAGDDGARASLVQRGRARAAGFSWEAAARKTVEVYRSLGIDC